MSHHHNDAQEDQGFSPICGMFFHHAADIGKSLSKSSEFLCHSMFFITFLRSLDISIVHNSVEFKKQIVENIFQFLFSGKFNRT